MQLVLCCCKMAGHRLDQTIYFYIQLVDGQIWHGRLVTQRRQAAARSIVCSWLCIFSVFLQNSILQKTWQIVSQMQIPICDVLMGSRENSFGPLLGVRELQMLQLLHKFLCKTNQIFVIDTGYLFLKWIRKNLKNDFIIRKSVIPRTVAFRKKNS